VDVNANFEDRVIVHGDSLDWQDSPMAGVKRRMLDRLGDEVARATTIVSYAPGSQFSPHVHTGGEEFIVLEGVFQDEHGDFPTGSYIRNPPTSKHTPGSAPGCVIFVKLWQFDPEDRTHVRVQMDKVGTIEDASRPGVRVTPLYEDARETVQIEYWQAGAAIELDAPEGAELLVIAGSCVAAEDELEVQSWMRLPIGSSADLVAGSEGTTVWIKSRHLKDVQRPNV